ncbi:hypothetical protein XarbCFBP8150_21545, partial [Xanthomonas arboricola]|uniref:putative PEP-binding protein n=1 Tax=Xanthomonas arboricola TaxID=56448 RepID=UPI000D498C1B
QAIREREAAQRALPAETSDGHHIDIGANVNLPDQVAMALTQGADVDVVAVAGFGWQCALRGLALADGL